MTDELANSAPRSEAMTFEDFCRQRGYDPERGCYDPDIAPDYGGKQHRQVST